MQDYTIQSEVISMTLGNRISRLRTERKYSQEYLAERMDVSRQAVSKWEKDLSSPDTKNLIRDRRKFCVIDKV